MLSLAVYKTIHYLGIFTLVTALTAALARAAAVGLSAHAGASAESLADPWKKRLGIAHGVGLFLVLLGGFGMLARLGLGLTGWVNVKLAIWLVVGGLIVLRKSPAAASWGVALVPLLAALAGYVAYTKPF